MAPIREREVERAAGDLRLVGSDDHLGSPMAVGFAADRHDLRGVEGLSDNVETVTVVAAAGVADDADPVALGGGGGRPPDS